MWTSSKPPVAGGWLAVGIPEYRLPKDVLKAEIKVIEDLGVKIHLNTRIGKDLPFEKLQKDYDAVFIGCGTVLSSKLDVPGEDMQGVIHGVDYLRRVNLGEKVFPGRRGSPSSAAGTSRWTPSGRPSAPAPRTYLFSIAAPARKCRRPRKKSRKPWRKGSRWNSWWPRFASSAKTARSRGSNVCGWNWANPMPAAAAVPFRSKVPNSSSNATQSFPPSVRRRI